MSARMVVVVTLHVSVRGAADVVAVSGTSSQTPTNGAAARVRVSGGSSLSINGTVRLALRQRVACERQLAAGQIVVVVAAVKPMMEEAIGFARVAALEAGGSVARS